VPDYVGQPPARANLGALRNRSLELAPNNRNQIGKLQYNFGVNFTKIDNKETDLAGASGNVLVQTSSTTFTEAGREIAYFYGLQAQGVFPSQQDMVQLYSPRLADGSRVQSKYSALSGIIASLSSPCGDTFGCFPLPLY